MTRSLLLWVVSFSLLGAACGGSATVSPVPPSDSEVAASVVSGALNNTNGDALGWNGLPRPRTSALARVIEALSPVRRAVAASWSCTTGSLAPPFAGPSLDPYAFTPVTCSITFVNGRSSSSAWSGPFTLVYGPTCDNAHPWIGNQAAGCSLTRTTPRGGITRTISGPLGGKYAVTHDTNGAGTGWDSGVTPAPSDGGVVITCGPAGCTGSSGSQTLVVHGSHFVGTVALGNRPASTSWDYTVSTGATPLTVAGSGTGRIVSGSLTVQHNLASETSTAVFDGVGFGAANCCFPTTGNVTTTFKNGSSVGRTETLTFSSVCGEATLANVSGTTKSITLLHCL